MFSVCGSAIIYGIANNHLGLHGCMKSVTVTEIAQEHGRGKFKCKHVRHVPGMAKINCSINSTLINFSSRASLAQLLI